MMTEAPWKILSGGGPVAAILGVLLVNLALSGDNAVVIAMTAKGLPERIRLRSLVLGAIAAMAALAVLSLFAAQLMSHRFVRLAGGLFIAWIAVKQFAGGSSGERALASPESTWQAVWTVLIANLAMSLDNVLAVAGASGGNLALLLPGLGLSVPVVFLAAGLLARLMERVPAIIYLGAAVLGSVAAGMVLTDPWVQELVHPSEPQAHAIQAVSAVAAIAMGRLRLHASVDAESGQG